MIDEFGAEFRIFVGLEEFTFPMMALGALGTMNAVANIVPDKIAALANETRAGNMLAARTLHFELFGLNKAVFYDTNPIPTIGRASCRARVCPSVYISVVAV